MNKLIRLFILAMLLGACPAWSTPNQVSDLVKLVEKRQGDWIAFKAHIVLEATQSDAPPASCEGQLAYERLNEKMMLLCLGEKKNLLFAFRSEDRKFEFYQPEASTLYYGSIFDLEDNLRINSHIKPLDLYRALKLNAISVKQARIDSIQGKTVSIAIDGTFQKKSYFKRLLSITQNGDVPLEYYFRPEGGIDAMITRSNFVLHKKQGLSGKESYVFPEQVSVEEPGNDHNPTRTTTLFFSNFEFNPEIAFKDWQIPVPEETKKINISEDFENLEKQAAQSQ